MIHHSGFPDMLNLIQCPAFCVQDGVITHCNEDALKLLLQPGTPISQLLSAGIEDYQGFTEGFLFLTLCHGGQALPFSVSHTEAGDIFVMEQDSQELALRTMSLISSKFRSPLFEVMLNVNRLLPMLEGVNAPEAEGLAEQINRGLYQMHRMVCNMSDTFRYAEGTSGHKSYRDVVSITAELLEHISVLAGECSMKLEYSLPREQIPCLIDEDLLERALYNMISNAIKHSDPGSVIRVTLTRNGKKLYYSVTDQGHGIDWSSAGNVFRSYQREPGLESPLVGLGLGLALVRCAAMVHEGTVLIDSPEGFTTRVTMSISISRPKTATVRSPLPRVDYAGERDHGLLELSDVLPAHLYKPTK